MCKLIAISGLTLKSTKQASALVSKSAELLGLSQKDGFGYSLKHQTGVYTERFINPSSCKGMGTMKRSIDSLPANLLTLEKQGVDFDSKGVYPSKGVLKGNFIAHGRTATCDKVISNTHPFSGNIDDKEWHIAHNGIVAWKGDKLPLRTTCDSEHLLNCFMYLKGEHSFKEHISGYAAIVGLNPSGDLFVLRDNKAPLYISYMKQLETFIICTDSSHCIQLAVLIASFYNLKNETYTEPVMLEKFVKHTFKASGEIDSNYFEEFSSTSPYISTASMYTSLGSAGAKGYTEKYQSRAWDDYDYDYYSRERIGGSATPITPSTPSTPTQTTLPLVGTSQSDLDKKAFDTHKAEMMANYKKNARKKYNPYKDTR